MKLRQLRAVMTVAHCGCISRAAGLLLVSQPAVTRSVSVAEKAIGVPLFKRSNSGVTLTAEGLLAVRTGISAFRRLAEIERRVVPEDQQPLCIATPFLRQVCEHELTALIAVSTSGSQRRAAGLLGVTQASVSRSLASLSSRLGRDLVSGDGTRRLTPWAAAAAMRAKRALAEIDALSAEISKARAERQGRADLRVGALPASRAWLIPEAIRAFSRTCPAARISIADGTYDALLAKLLAGDIDAVIGSLRADDTPDWVDVTPLFHDSLVLACRPDHPLARRRRLKPHDLARGNWVLPPAGTPLRREFDAMLAEARVSPPPRVVEADSFVVARALLAGGEWIGVFSASQIEPDQRNGLLVRLAPPDTPKPRPVGILTRKGEQPSADHACFLRHLATAADHLLGPDRSGGSDRYAKVIGAASI